MARYRPLPELLDLAGAACDGRLDEESVARVETMLSQNDDACALWLRYMQLDADLRVLVATSSAERQTIARLNATAGLGLPIAPPESPPAGYGLHLLMGGFVLATMGVLVAFSIFFFSQVADRVPVAQDSPPAAALPTPSDEIALVRPPEQIAMLSNVEKDAVWAGEEDYEVGQLLPRGARLDLRTGSAQIRMTCGVDVVLQAPCTLVLSDSRLVQLESGALTAQVAEWARGFVVETRGLKVTDLGTRFAVSAESLGAAEAHVLDGSILAKPRRAGDRDQAELLLREGEAIRVCSREGTVDRFAAERERFPERFDAQRPFRPIELLNTGRGFLIGDKDPHWRITAGPKSVGPWPQPAFVTLPNVRYSDNAPEKSQWISVEGGTARSMPRNTVFTFETTFDLTGFDPATVGVVAQILADNGVKAIRLNGKPVEIEAWVDNTVGQRFQTFHVVEFREGFVEGENRVEVDVFNGISVGVRSANPMALRVELQAFGCSSKD
ncbi:MAG: FecR domain-containing protein [Pirellulaceae bacterium]|nr:FecR domain-containing protein [Pirellulaceae bacterium]